ncbi:MAG: flagellar assembly protein FliW [Anaerovoracaceae bacterium]|jgi:flagellar assembly factor FliW|nr:flagellar assembly protein FliW [Clostridiales bacterium]
MEINTRDFGLVQVDEDDLYEFNEGIYGFEDCKKFAVFKKSFDDISFLYLQSVEQLDPCFLVFNPWDLYPGYKPILSNDDMNACDADTIEDLIFLVIASIPSSIEEMSFNIKSPVVLNPRNKKAKQVILLNKDYSVRYQPFLKDGKAGH